MVAAAAEAVGAPDLPDVEPDPQPVGEAVEDSARCCATGCRSRRRGCASRPRARPAPASAGLPTARGMRGIAHAVGRAMIADDVVVEDGDDVPALRLGVVGEHLAAVEPLLLARQRGIDDRARELVLRQHPRRLQHRGHARPVVVRARSVGGEIHHVGHAAVDMALDDDHVVGPLGPALDRDHVAHRRRLGDARAGERLAWPHRRQAVAIELRLGPAERRADPPLGIGLRRQRVPRSEAHQASRSYAEAAPG